jgi:hypothetical protein
MSKLGPLFPQAKKLFHWNWVKCPECKGARMVCYSVYSSPLPLHGKAEFNPLFACPMCDGVGKVPPEKCMIYVLEKLLP